MKQWSYLNTAVQLINDYHGEEPFASFIKKYFSAHKKYGSKDRKQVSHLCYCFFRLGQSMRAVPVEERVIIGLFFCSDQPNDMLDVLRPDWNQVVGLSLPAKYSLVTGKPGMPDVFPWKDELSDGVSHEKFSGSFFIQPDLFLRLRPGHKTEVKDKLRMSGIDFTEVSENALALRAAARLDEVIEINKEAVVQDFNSQGVGTLLEQALLKVRERRKGMPDVWDCCAASGGKSIMAYDIDHAIRLTVSDIRASILINLRKRLLQAGISNYNSFVADLTEGSVQQGRSYDLIICDAPCTGSGTWGRTPEQLYFFEQTTIQRYASLQQNILRTIIPQLRNDGFLLYITCSVFKKENEDAVDYIKENCSLELVSISVLKGYEIKADTMFAALFRKK